MAHILVVDDDEGFREGLVETLLDLGHDVDEANSGEQALEVLQDARAFTCVFLDFRLPGMDGLALLEAIRAEPRWRLLPVVMLTGFATSDNTIGAMTLGAFEHLTKPVGRLAIQSLLERIVSSEAPSEAVDEQASSFPSEVAAKKPRLLAVTAPMRALHQQ